MKNVRHMLMIGALALSDCCRMSRSTQVKVPNKPRTFHIKGVIILHKSWM